MSELVSLGQQHSINFTGNPISVDGIWGSETQGNAVRCLQVACNNDYGSGLDVDGDMGALTSAAISGHYVERGETQYLVTAVEIMLYMRGYDPNGVENPGEFGDGLYNAVVQFQQDNGLEVDGIAGVNTICALIGEQSSSSSSCGTIANDDGSWRNYDPNNLPNFDANEFKCECGCGGDIEPELKCKIQAFRDKIGMPVVVTSGFRCPSQNAKVGGVSYSLHMKGLACDIQVPKNGVYQIPDDDQRYYREIAHQCGMYTGNYYGSGGGWMHLEIGPTAGDYDEFY